MTAAAGDSVTTGRPEAGAIWHFGPDDAPVRVAGAEALLAHLPIFLGGWPLRRVADAAPGCDVLVRTEPGGAIAVETFGPGGAVLRFDNEMDAANGLAGALVAEYVAARADTVCLHAGSALVGAGLCVVLGASLAGKSSVAMQLAASGYRLFGDDRLAVRPAGGDAPAEGLCLGLQPKLRLPLPDDAGPALAGFLESYTEIRTETTAYLRPWDTEAAGFGDAAPLGALVALERGEDGDAPATLEPAPTAEIARALLANVFAAHMTAETLVTGMTRLAARVPGYRLRWTSSRAAARLLADALKEISPR
jgi:hypothetical protein